MSAPANNRLSGSRPAAASSRRRVLGFATLFMGVISMSSALADRDLFTALAAPPAAVLEINDEQHAAACREIEQTVLTYLRQNVRIERRRCFLLQPNTPWNSMEKFIDSQLARQGGKRVSFDWHDPGIDLVAVWKIGRFRAEHVAVAMGSQTIDGQRLVGYFDVQQR
jgi:hypothetical protein